MRRELYRLGEAEVVSGGDDAHLPCLPAPRVIAVCFDGKWFRTVDDFFAKAEINGELLTALYEELYDFEVE